MKQVTIDLTGPFEDIVMNLRSVPPTDHFKRSQGNAECELSPEVEEVARSIYEAARGRQFATQIGFVPAGPSPIAPFLKDAPFQVESQADFLLQALARLYRGSGCKAEARSVDIDRGVCDSKATHQANGFSHRQHENFLTQLPMTTTMTNLPIHITTHHLSLSDPLRRFARKKIAPLARFANDALAAEIVLRQHNGAVKRFSASARLALPGRDVHGRGIDENLYVAIGKLVAALGRRLRKRKTRLAKKFQKADPIGTLVERLEPPADREPLSPPPEDMRKPRPREGGQEMRVYPFRRSLSVGAEAMNGEKPA